jgi:hypothetical protein
MMPIPSKPSLAEIAQTIDKALRAEAELAALRLALREPSDELIDLIAQTAIAHVPLGALGPGYCKCGEPTEGWGHRARMVLTALIEAVTPDGQ